MRSGSGDTQRVGLIVVGVVATLLLAGLSVLAVGLFAGSVGTGTSDFRASSACPSPSLAGTVVHVELTNMGGPMMGQGSGMMSGGAMGLNADQATVVHGTVSFFVTNNGSLTHELVILPLPGSQIAGTRQIGGDARIGETGSLGEASASCGEGPGEGILPGASSWVTVTLAPGRYELVCNLSGHYAAGMYTQITVT